MLMTALPHASIQFLHTTLTQKVPYDRGPYDRLGLLDPSVVCSVPPEHEDPERTSMARLSPASELTDTVTVMGVETSHLRTHSQAEAPSNRPRF